MCSDEVERGKRIPSADRKGATPGAMTLITNARKRCRRLRGFQKVKCASRPIGVAGQPKTRCSFARASKSNAITPAFASRCTLLLFAALYKYTKGRAGGRATNRSDRERVDGISNAKCLAQSLSFESILFFFFFFFSSSPSLCKLSPPRFFCSSSACFSAVSFFYFGQRGRFAG